jgi:hypothetical protein
MNLLDHFAPWSEAGRRSFWQPACFAEIIAFKITKAHRLGQILAKMRHSLNR